MTHNQQIPIPSGFKAVSILALIWNLMGVIAFVATLFISPEMLAELPAAEQELRNSTPLWADLAFGFAVLSGTLGSLALLLRKAWAAPVFMVSLLSILVQMIHSFFISNALNVLGPERMIMPVMVIVFAIILVWFSHKAKTNQWID